MKIGDVITDLNNDKWIIFDTHEDNYCVTDLASQSIDSVIPWDRIISHEDCKVEWLFLKRRERNLEGLERFTK